MGRPRRTQVGGLVYHVLNRANARSQIFADAGDYAAFLRALADAQAQLSAGPLPLPPAWTELVNAPQTSAEKEAIRRCGRRGQPFGTVAWAQNAVQSFGLQCTQRRPGRPPRASHPGQSLLFEENGS